MKFETSPAYSSVLMSASSLSGVNGLLFAIAREANSSVAAVVERGTFILSACRSELFPTVAAEDQLNLETNDR